MGNLAKNVLSSNKPIVLLYYKNRFLTKKKKKKKEIVYSFVESVLLISVLYRSASGYFLSSSRKMQFW